MTENRRHPHVVNLDELHGDEQSTGAFGFKRKRMGPEAGGRALGCSHFELAPGKTAFPYHFHSASGVDPVKGFRGGTWVMKLIKEEQPQVGYFDDEPLAKKG